MEQELEVDPIKDALSNEGEESYLNLFFKGLSPTDREDMERAQETGTSHRGQELISMSKRGVVLRGKKENRNPELVKAIENYPHAEFLLLEGFQAAMGKYRSQLSVAESRDRAKIGEC